MTQQAQQATESASARSSGRLWSDRRLQSALLIVMVMLLETLPIEAWQLILAGYSHTITRPPLPWWLLLAIPLVSYLTIPAGTRGRRRFAGGAFIAFVILVALLLRFSPATYADTTHGVFSLGWLSMLGNDAATGDARFGAVVALIAVAVYLRWRGARLKSARLDTQDTLQRFKYGMAIITVAAVVALTLDTSQKSIALGVLALLLPLEVFVGLVGASLARVQHLRMQRTSPAQIGAEAQWLRVTFGFAGLVVAFALVVSLIVNYRAVGSLLTHFGPVGQLILWLVTTVVGALVQVMAFLLNPIVSFLKHIIPHPTPRTPAATGNGAGLCIPGPNLKCRTSTTPQDNVAPIARLAMELLLLIAASGVFLFILRLFFLRNGVERDTNMDDDEREALDARGLFRAQLHTVIHNLGRKSQPEEPEALPAGSVRYAYREVLRAATARGLHRASSETPDEYARRLTSTAPLNAATGGEASDLDDLSRAYNAARYADREPSPREREGLLTRASKLARTLRPPRQ